MNVPPVTDPPRVIKESITLLKHSGVSVKKLSTRDKLSKKTLTLDSSELVFAYSPSVQPVSNTIMPVREIVSIVVEPAKPHPDRADSKIYGIIIKVKGKKFKFYFDQESQQQRVSQAMAYVVRNRNKQMDEDPLKIRVVELWLQVDNNGDRRVSMVELIQLLEILNIQMNRKMVKNLMIEFDTDKSGFLDFEEFSKFFTRLMERNEFNDMFHKYTSPDSPHFLTPLQLQKFLADVQGEIVDEETAKNICTSLGAGKQLGINVLQFSTMLLSSLNDWCHPQHKTIYQDMNQPLHHYFIASSHNTYLSGDQLQSNSKVEKYKIALDLGCRCVELDCWDGPNGEPIIYHGYTRTSKISFREVIACINQNAFVASSYPVILSLEIHTSVAQQRVMANIMTETFGSKLGRFEDIRGDRYTPNALQHKILVKAKMLPQDEDDKDEEGAEEIDKAPKNKVVTYSPDLSNTVGVPAKKTHDWGLTSEPQHCQSYSETKTESLAKQPVNFRNMNTRMFSRIYPKGSRVNSSNYNPMLAWTMGCQIVALNYQTFDYPMRLNIGRFKQNGNCGYVLKPAWLRTPDAQMPQVEYELTVEVLLGSQIPKPNLSLQGETIDPYVEVFVNGIPEDTTPTPFPRTKTVDNNGFNPFWGEQFTFKIKCLDLATLTIRVMDEDVGSSDLVAEATLPMESVRLGYRSVQLMNPITGLDIQFATVLCRFQLKKL